MPKKPVRNRFRTKNYYKEKKAAKEKARELQEVDEDDEQVNEGQAPEGDCGQIACIENVKPVLQVVKAECSRGPQLFQSEAQQQVAKGEQYICVEEVNVDSTVMHPLPGPTDNMEVLVINNETMVQPLPVNMEVLVNNTETMEQPLLVMNMEVLINNTETMEQPVPDPTDDMEVLVINNETMVQPLPVNMEVLVNKTETMEQPVPEHTEEQVVDPVEAIQTSLPPRWIVSKAQDGFHISLYSAEKVLQRSIFVAFSGDVQFIIHGHKLQSDHPNLKHLMKVVQFSKDNVKEFVSDILNIVKEVRLLEICAGAYKLKFKHLWKSSLETCVLDNNTFQEARYNETIRSKNCQYLVPQRRKCCVACYKVLSNFADRFSSPTKKTPNKFKGFKYLNSAEKKAKDSRSYKTIRNLRRQNQNLLAKLITDDGLELDDDLGNSIESILEEEEINLAKKLEAGNSSQEKQDEDQFFLIFIQQQLQARKVKSARAMKWHPLMIRFALQLQMCSTSAGYNNARRFIKLPSDRTLYDYTHIYDVKPGCQFQFINETSEKVRNMEHDYQKYHVLMFDEMYVREKIAQKKSTGEIIGYCSLSEVQSEMLELRHKLQGEAQGLKETAVKEPPTTKRMLTYMVKGTASGICNSVASYTVDVLTREDLHQHTWEVIGHLESAGIAVIACVCDGSSVNRGFFDMQPPASGRLDSGGVFDTMNPFAPDRNIFFISDPPHLLKTTRNALENSGRKKSRQLTIQGELLTWQTIIQLFQLKSEQTVKKLPRLTPECVFLNSYSRMRVSFAARVLNQSIHQHKPNLAPYSNLEDERFQKFEQMLLYLRNWKEEIELMPNLTREEKKSRLLPQATIDGWEMVCRALPLAIKFLLSRGTKFVMARIFCQDPVEQRFSKHRAIDANPEPEKFLKDENTLNLQGKMKMKRRGANTETAGSSLDMTPLPKRPKTVRRALL
ncbi:DNA transposase [Frankliniella fusca]|uniref:DNA transposase n=1 Tax=Frankliniella fusca TaxID=407009 RepID=A0AAE1L800_9NEOP|nr:DNA transposase [Frankliniella fusca]